MGEAELLCISRARKGGLGGSVESKSCEAENAQMVSYDLCQHKGHGKTLMGFGSIYILRRCLQMLFREWERRKKIGIRRKVKWLLKK